MKKYSNPKLEVLESTAMDILTISGPEIFDTNETPGVSILPPRNQNQ